MRTLGEDRRSRYGHRESPRSVRSYSSGASRSPVATSIRSPRTSMQYLPPNPGGFRVRTRRSLQSTEQVPLPPGMARSSDRDSVAPPILTALATSPDTTCADERRAKIPGGMSDPSAKNMTVHGDPPSSTNSGHGNSIGRLPRTRWTINFGTRTRRTKSNTPLPRLSPIASVAYPHQTVNWNHTRLRLQNLVFCGANACSDRKVMQLAGQLWNTAGNRKATVRPTGNVVARPPGPDLSPTRSRNLSFVRNQEGQ